MILIDIISYYQRKGELAPEENAYFKGNKK
jgi:hypothetical protein